ncbi:helix-hairpin-helix domain-containing protein [Parahaliea maris]|uniref:Helix-hairpin-helix domain-containing protein n=1 Tax=Parahaliea maris TaxID=2716870 RepID=A0A5C9A686_9GAMM|nr:helix-hairpin-helix domain-containing protein [Parahaliea maris]TXS96226.1 helix-hairpin-helix domain-containing protein [Parahaliea maris]
MNHSPFSRTAPGYRLGRLLKHLQSTSLATLLALTAVTGLLLPDTVRAQETVAAATVQVNINSANAATLAAQLSGVGLSRAQEIVRYREMYGPFKSVDELVDVKGIGPATLDRNRAVITLE